MNAPTAYQQLILDLLNLAAQQGASDVHFEPLEGRLRVRMRVDGVLQTVQEVEDRLLANRLMELLKGTAGFDMGKIGIPQDSRFRTEVPNMDYRAALIPVMYGEKVVLRLLERGKVWSLDTYPLRRDAKVDLRRALGKRDGLIVVSGPTGSGKSTLLYSALGSLDRDRLNIGTIEDPVEYHLDGINQSPVRRHKGSTFASLLRAFLRGDPDVILVGEVRDEETAEAVMHAATTGHLVVTTVHANSAGEIRDRLQGLGVHPELYEANLRFASAQRLVPKLCPRCRERDPEGPALVQATFPTLADHLRGRELITMRSPGCEACKGRGVMGRALLFEWVTRFDGELKRRGALAATALQQLMRGEIDAHTACAH